MAIVISPRGACPTLVRPMRTGDGFLARLPPLLVPLDPRQLADIAAAAVGHGNGLVEISSRGNIQIRGVAESGGPALAEALAGAGLDLRPGIPISVDPLLDRETQAAAISPWPLASFCTKAVAIWISACVADRWNRIR